MKKRATITEFSTPDALRAELERMQRRERRRRSLRSVIYTLMIMTAAALAAAVFFVSVLEVYGSSMEPTLSERELVLAIKTSDIRSGDILALDRNNTILIKRCVATEGDRVDIAADGTVSVNGVTLDEPYVADTAPGDYDIALPFQVPESQYFILGDNRAASIDSRNSSLGCAKREQLMGKVVFRVWPLSRFGLVR